MQEFNYDFGWHSDNYKYTNASSQEPPEAKAYTLPELPNATDGMPPKDAQVNMISWGCDHSSE